MHRRSVLRAGAAALLCGAALAPSALAATPAPGETLKGYTAVVDSDSHALLGDLGIDLHETGFDRTKREAQRVHIDVFPTQAKELEARGIDLESAPAYTGAPKGAPQAQARGAARAKPETGGDSPNQFYDVFRSYMEPGGIADELRELAKKYPADAKLVQIGTSTRGKPILALKVTKDARNTPDGERPSVLYSGVNHAREWIAAETARRMPTWFLEHKDEPKTRQILDRAELWFLPIQNPDGYEYTFTCGQGDGTPANVPCGAKYNPGTGLYGYVDANENPVGASNRQWRKTLRDNNANGTFGDALDGVDPNRNYPTAWNLDEEGASNSPQSGNYRGPYPLSEPEDLAYDRLLRKVTPEAVINYHSAAQLLLYPFGYITDVSSDDNPWFVALTGTDGDAAVDPYISERSSDLYITNGETTDHAYNKYRSMAWTPELDECNTGGGGQFCVQGSGGSGFTFPDDETKVEAVFEKNLDFARNVATTVTDRDRPDRPKQANEDESSYQVKGSPDIEANSFPVSFGNPQGIEANVRRVLGAVDAELAVAAGPGGTARTLVLRMNEQRGGERFGDLRGKYYRRMSVTPPSSFIQPDTTQAARPLLAGDVVTVTIRAGGQQQQFRYRVQSTRPAGAAKRVLVIAAEDYTGVSPNKTPYATAPRYAGDYTSALTAAGYAVETFDVDAPPAGITGTTPTKYISKLGVLSHFDAVVYETGDDLVPQDLTETVTDTTYRRATGLAAPTQQNPQQTTAFAGSSHVARYGPRNWQALRDYMNEGGKLVYAGRNLFTPQVGTSTALTSYSNYTWWQEPAFGFDYPANQAGDDDRPGTAFFRELDISNDFGAYFLGVQARQGGPFTTSYTAATAAPLGTGGIFAGMGPLQIDTAAGAGATADPTQDPTTGAATPVAKVPQRLRNFSSVSAQRAIRQERIELDYASQVQSTTTTSNGVTTTNPTGNGGGAAVSTRDSVSFGFGLEQVPAAQRQELLSRSLGYLLPTAPDATQPTADFVRPDANAAVTPRDPIELEVDAFDDRGDLKEVRFLVNDRLVQTKVSFPFQGRYTPTAAEVGSSIELKAQVEDKTGNVRTVIRTVRVVAGAAATDSPLATGKPTLTGEPVAGGTLTCVTGGFANGPTSTTYEWLRNGAVIGGQSQTTYRPTGEDVGRDVACRITGTNEAGSGDATSEARTVVAAPAAPTPAPPTTTPTNPTPPTTPAPPVVKPNSPIPTFTVGAFRISRTGRVAVTVRCPVAAGTVGCKGTVSLRSGRSVLGTTKYTLAAGKSKAISVLVRRSTRTTLSKRRSLKVDVRVSNQSGSLNTVILTRSATLKAALRR